MIDRGEATARARDYVKSLKWPGVEEMVLYEHAVLERPYGWVFFYNSRAFMQSGKPEDAAIGNGPFVVDRRDGSIHVTGRTMSYERFLEEYARSRGPEP
jgi:hypothetical protein